MSWLDAGIDISRRDFLKLAGFGLIGSLLPFGAALPAAAQSSGQLGRVLENTVPLFDLPSLHGKQVSTVLKDHLYAITDVTAGDASVPYNRIWYQLDNRGYAHSGSIQPVRIALNEPAGWVSPSGQVGEVTVPYTDARRELAGDTATVYRLYYGTAYWVVSLEKDPQGSSWYGILDDRLKSVYYAQARHIRLIPAQELGPISSDVPPGEKRIEVYLGHQAVIAYEGERSVFMTRCATGARFASGNFSTPPGKYIIYRKSPSRHMASGDKVAADGYDLPGVPWVSFITEDGISFHGTYWHNNFGKPRSHGCINVSIPAANWIYRWSLPVVPPDQVYVYETQGTNVVVI